MFGFLFSAQSWQVGRSLRPFVAQARSNSSEMARSLMFPRADCAGGSTLLRTRGESGSGDASIEQGNGGQN